MEDSRLEEYEKAIYGDTRGSNLYNENVYDIWTTWLYLAGIEKPEQYNSQDIVLNQELMQRVMGNEAAVKYMLNSKYFIMPKVLKSEVAMSEARKSNVTVKAILENGDWISEFKYNVLPVMSSNITEGVKLTVSNGVVNETAYKITDGNSSTGCDTISGNYDIHWIQIEFAKPKYVTNYYLLGMASGGALPTFYIDASNDGTNWTRIEGETVHTGNASHYSGQKEFNVDIESPGFYKYYRIYSPTGGWTYGSSGSYFVTVFKLFGL